MKTNQPKLKTQLFSCGFFRHCTQTVLSPTSTPHPQTFPLSSSDQPPPPPPPQLHPAPRRPSVPESSSSSSSSSTSQSFTQWRFQLPHSPILPSPPPVSEPMPEGTLPSDPVPLPALIPSSELQELFHIAELQLSTGSDQDRLAALQLLERSLVPNPPSDPECSPELMRGVVGSLKTHAGAKPATKILLALCLAEGNRHVAVEAGAVSAVVEAAPELDDAAVERALAALELMCTVPEGAAEVRAHALAVPVMVAMMGRMAARAKEYAISVLAVIYGGEGSEEQAAPAEEVARAVALALRGDCSARGRRKGAQLLKALEVEENCGAI
ncbi:U-box domain-containing protein 25 [Juglans microcarpa x Juglans regia]|uniref:U-box domain-containing protein 25 n=1 Tax=Juglans microcarpa x Juglans regia TaxID=2249226 RepID=UPI001B7E7439|nr:U-box domain-containing protein 25 [Juglans microcarpa x Juglans regia]